MGSMKNKAIEEAQIKERVVQMSVSIDEFLSNSDESKLCCLLALSSLLNYKLKDEMALDKVTMVELNNILTLAFLIENE